MKPASSFDNISRGGVDWNSSRGGVDDDDGNSCAVRRTEELGESGAIACRVADARPGSAEELRLGCGGMLQTRWKLLTGTDAKGEWLKPNRVAVAVKALQFEDQKQKTPS